MSEPDPPVDRGRSPGSRLLSGVDRLASRPLAALIVLTADIAWVLVSVAAGFPSRWESVFQSLVAALTLAHGLRHPAHSGARAGSYSA